MQPNIQPFTCSRLFNRFDNRLYSVNGVAYKGMSVMQRDATAKCLCYDNIRK